MTGFGLIAALEFLLSHTIENYEFSAAENLEERIEFPLNIQLQIYRITQEVLTNIKRHASAAIVGMHVDITPDGEFVLTINDDGTGNVRRLVDRRLLHTRMEAPPISNTS